MFLLTALFTIINKFDSHLSLSISLTGLDEIIYFSWRKTLLPADIKERASHDNVFFSHLLKKSLSFDRIPLGQLVAGKQREKFLLIGTFFGEKNLFIVVARRETKLSVPRKGG